MQSIKQLIQGLDVQLSNVEVDDVVTTVVEHSRRAEEGACFVARSGHRRDGAAFIEDAIERGATVIVCTPDVADSLKHKTVGCIVTYKPEAIGAVIAERFYGNPSSSIKLIGVTGTNGKTTVAWLVRHILRSCSIKCGMLGTIVCDDGHVSKESVLTTPSFCDNSRLLRSMIDNDCTAAVMECSSHALDQGRVAALKFNAGIFTNFSGDHLDYHGSPAAYLQAKMRLFDLVHESAIINMDDPASWSIADRCHAHVYSCRTDSDAAAGWVEVKEETLGGSLIALHGPWGTIELLLPLIGRHNAINALQAAFAAHLVGANAEGMRRALETAEPPPGRLERVGSCAVPVFVDFAHTDDALEQMLESVRHILPEGGKLHVVFGCGGDRDRSKRPRMGRIASTIGDVAYATSDNPRSEDPDAILDEVLSGVPYDRRSCVYRITDRKQAIEKAINDASECDVVVIAGKGHEKNQILKDETIPFDDVLIAQDAIDERLQSNV